MDCSWPGSSVHGVLQARVLERLLCPPRGNPPNQEWNSGLLHLQVGSLSRAPPAVSSKLWVLPPDTLCQSPTVHLLQRLRIQKRHLSAPPQTSIHVLWQLSHLPTLSTSDLSMSPLCPGLRCSLNPGTKISQEDARELTVYIKPSSRNGTENVNPGVLPFSLTPLTSLTRSSTFYANG